MTQHRRPLLGEILFGRIEEGLLRDRVRDLLRADRLPAEGFLRLRARPASGRPCSCCDEPISTGTEFGAESGESPDWRFHPRCHEIWKEERFTRGKPETGMIT
jgi:hypothetical protein